MAVGFQDVVLVIILLVPILYSSSGGGGVHAVQCTLFLRQSPVAMAWPWKARGVSRVLTLDCCANRYRAVQFLAYSRVQNYKHLAHACTLYSISRRRVNYFTEEKGCILVKIGTI